MKKINKLQTILPDLLLADAPWLASWGYSGVQVNKYAASGWLQRPARGVYMRPGCRLHWQAAVVSLQTLVGAPLSIGGLTALEMQGRAHFIYPQMPGKIFLYGPKPPPGWLAKLNLSKKFVFRKTTRLFAARKYWCQTGRCQWDFAAERFVPQPQPAVGIMARMWSERNFPLQVSVPERALLEFIDELPENYPLTDADLLIEGMVDMKPQLLQDLLADCTSVKVKRLALWFIERHHPRLLDGIDQQCIDLGRGNRVLVKEGFLDRKYRITLPKSMKHVSKY